MVRAAHVRSGKVETWPATQATQECWPIPETELARESCMEGSLEAYQGKHWVSPKDPDDLWWGTHPGLMWGAGRLEIVFYLLPKAWV